MVHCEVVLFTESCPVVPRTSVDPTSTGTSRQTTPFPEKWAGPQEDRGGVSQAKLWVMLESKESAEPRVRWGQESNELRLESETTNPTGWPSQGRGSRAGLQGAEQDWKPGGSADSSEDLLLTSCSSWYWELICQRAPFPRWSVL